MDIPLSFPETVPAEVFEAVSEFAAAYAYEHEVRVLDGGNVTAKQQWWNGTRPSPRNCRL
jgi:hypothetical protein